MKTLTQYITEASATKYIKLLHKFIEMESRVSARFLSPDTIIPYGQGGVGELTYVGRKWDNTIEGDKTPQSSMKPVIGMVELRGKVYMVLRTYGDSFHNNLYTNQDTTSFIGSSDFRKEDVFVLIDMNDSSYESKLNSQATHWQDRLTIFKFSDPEDPYNSGDWNRNHLDVDRGSTHIYTFYNEEEKKKWISGEEVDVNEARGLFDELTSTNVELYTINVKSYLSLDAGSEDDDEFNEYINELQKPLLKSDAITKELGDWYNELTEKFDWFKDHKVGIRIDSKAVADLRSSIDDVVDYIKTVNKDIMSFKQGKIKKIDSLQDLEDNLGVISYYCKTVVPRTSQKNLIPLVAEFDRSISSEPSKIHQTIIEPFKVKLPASKMTGDIPSFKMNSSCETFLELVGALYKLDTKAQTKYEKYLKTVK